MDFKEYVEEILQKEVSDVVNQQGYFLEKEFCTMMCEKYKLSVFTVQGTLRKIYPTMDLIKRRVTNEIKQFYDLQIKGCPIVYLINKNS